MIKFEEKYLYTFANADKAKKLIGKKGILFSDACIDSRDLQRKELVELAKIGDDGSTFKFKCETGIFYQFFYYDPHLEIKRAYENGETIQYATIDGGWADVDRFIDPDWDDDLRYRIKPKTKIQLTNKEVAEWLSRGKGQILINNYISTSMVYRFNKANDICHHLIRRWSDTNWNKATKEYIEGDT